METTIVAAVAKFSTRELQNARRTIEAELMAACAAGVDGTQAHVGQLEMLGAIGAELDVRNALEPLPPFVDTCIEHGPGDVLRLPFQIRVV
jgi:hypothetical protein